MSRRKSTRTRSTKSKYFAADDVDIDGGDEDRDSDYVPNEEGYHDTLVGAKTRKRKSTIVIGSSEKSKRSRVPSSTRGLKKKGKAAQVEHTRADHNNNSEPAHLNMEEGGEEEDSDDDDGQDWEEVQDADVFDIDGYQPQLPSNLKITVEKPKKEKKQGDWVERYIRQEINRIRKKIQLDSHKTHLLLLIARLRYLNALSNDPTIQALIMSIIPAKLKPTKESVTKFIPKIFNWLNDEFKVNINRDQIDVNLNHSIISSFEAKSITSPIVLMLIFVATLRRLMLHTRLCYFLYPISVKASNLLTKKTKGKKSNGSTDSQSNSDEDWKSNYHWIEVYDRSKKKWNCFNFVNNEIQSDAYTIGAEPGIDVTYIIAIDNEDFVSEVTARYAVDWVSYAIKKRRVEDGWWEDTLKLFQRPDFSVYEDADKKEFDQMMAKVELPTKLSDYKNHPLFVLQRDILKFQAIYPPDAPTLGFFREQPVFSRDCVANLKSRETWLRSARTVKIGESAYKVVDSRSKNDDKRGRKAKLDLFGEWQTEQYVPPVAKNGIVPKNSYGNVSLFQECMLPVGTVYLKHPGLSRIAAKLNIDFAPAVIGFDCVKNHRVTRPIIEGVVICAEFEDILLDAWKEKQGIIQEKEKKDRITKIYDNWKRLIKGLFIREKLKIKYG